MKESDTLQSNDTYCEMVTRKMAGQLGNLLNNDNDRLQEILQVNGKTCKVRLHLYATLSVHCSTHCSDVVRSVVECTGT